jgi:hypothetical protein
MTFPGRLDRNCSSVTAWDFGGIQSTIRQVIVKIMEAENSLIRNTFFIIDPAKRNVGFCSILGIVVRFTNLHFATDRFQGFRTQNIAP